MAYLPLVSGPLEAGADLVDLTILAVLQGLTEFLPVSSSGHLVLGQAWLGIEEAPLTIDIALHVGTLLAVLAVYGKDLLKLGLDFVQGRWREPLWIVLGTIPAGVIGLTFKDTIEEIFHDARFAAYGLFATSTLLLVGEFFRRRAAGGGPPAEEEDEDPIQWWQVLVVGSAQALAIWPGISRSGSTIAAGLVCGWKPARAARFSFLLSVPAILGAAVLQIPDASEQLDDGVGALVLAGLVAGAVGFVALRLLLRFLARGAFAWFAVYCTTLGVAALFWLGAR